MQRRSIAALMISLLLLSACGHGAGERSFQTFRDTLTGSLVTVTALPYVVDAVRSGYVDLTWQEDGLLVVQLITDDHTVVRLYLDGTVPQCAELSVDERSCLYCTVEQWNLEQGSTNDESQNSNMGRDQSQ